MAEKRKKLHSPFRNFLYKLIRNRYFYFFTAIVVGAAFIVGIFAVRDNGTVKPINGKPTGEVTSVTELKDLEIYFLDVGQGDCVLVKFPDGKNMLVDGGKNDSSVKSAIDKYLTVDGQKAVIDYCVATHPDEDHIGALPYVYEHYQVGYSYRPYVYCGNAKDLSDGFEPINSKVTVTTAAYAEYLSAVNAESCGYEYFTDKSDFTNTVTVNNKIYSYTVDFVLPYARSVSGFDDFTDTNDYSAVIMIKYNDRKILLTGDINFENGKNSTERKIVANYEKDFDYLSCDILKVAHHGSGTSSCIEFLNAAKPDYAVISCGAGNDYNHPNREVLNRLTSENCVIYRTDLQGTIKFSINENGDIAKTVETYENDDYLFFSGEELMRYADIAKIKNNKLQAKSRHKPAF